MAGALRAEATLAVANGLYLIFLLLGGIVFPTSHLGPWLTGSGDAPPEHGAGGYASGCPGRQRSGTAAELARAGDLGGRGAGGGGADVPLGVMIEFDSEGSRRPIAGGGPGVRGRIWVRAARGSALVPAVVAGAVADAAAGTETAVVARAGRRRVAGRAGAWISGERRSDGTADAHPAAQREPARHRPAADQVSAPASSTPRGRVPTCAPSRRRARHAGPDGPRGHRA